MGHGDLLQGSKATEAWISLRFGGQRFDYRGWVGTSAGRVRRTERCVCSRRYYEAGGQLGLIVGILRIEARKANESSQGHSVRREDR